MDKKLFKDRFNLADRCFKISSSVAFGLLLIYILMFGVDKLLFEIWIFCSIINLILYLFYSIATKESFLKSILFYINKSILGPIGLITISLTIFLYFASIEKK